MGEISNMASKGWFGVGGEMLEDSANKGVQKREANANSAAAARQAEAVALQSLQDETKKKAAARLNMTTSGFASGAPTARQFLTTF